MCVNGLTIGDLGAPGYQKVYPREVALVFPNSPGPANACAQRPLLKAEDMAKRSALS
jgi:hypothetical protein